MRRILIVLSCLCLQSEGHAMFSQELGVIARSTLRRLKPTTVFKSLSTLSPDFSSMPSEEKGTPKFTVRFPEIQDSILKNCRDRFYKVTLKTPRDSNEIREYHEEVTTIENTINAHLDRSSYFKDIDGNILDAPTLKDRFGNLFTQLALNS